MIHMGIELSGTCVVLTRSAHMLRPDANVLSRKEAKRQRRVDRELLSVRIKHLIKLLIV